MVVHRHEMRPTLARLCRLLTKSPAVEAAPKAAAVVNAAQIVSAAESAPAAPHA
jgi:acetyl-CoA carboxylase carboxyl transferase subunit beta